MRAGLKGLPWVARGGKHGKGAGAGAGAGAAAAAAVINDESRTHGRCPSHLS